MRKRGEINNAAFGMVGGILVLSLILYCVAPSWVAPLGVVAAVGLLFLFIFTKVIR